MTPQETPKRLTAEVPVESLEELTLKQRAELNDPDVQARNHREMLRQLRLRQCPGCGEDDIF